MYAGRARQFLPVMGCSGTWRGRLREPGAEYRPIRARRHGLSAVVDETAETRLVLPGAASDPVEQTATEPTDYDGHWKDALEAYFRPCLSLLCPDLSDCIDWSHAVQFLDKELRAIAGRRQRARRYVDKLVQLRLRQGQEVLLLLHIEVQARLRVDFPARMFGYFARLRERHPRHELVQLAVITRGRRVEPWLQYRYAPLGGNFLRLAFELPVIHLQDWSDRLPWLAEQVATNPFALVVLAELEAARRQAPHGILGGKIGLVRMLYAHGYGEQDIRRLFAFIDGILVLPQALEDQFSRVVDDIEKEQNVAFVTSIERVAVRKGLQQGLQQGMQQGRSSGMREMLQSLLEQRFGVLPPAVLARLHAADVEQLRALSARLLDAKALADLWA